MKPSSKSSQAPTTPMYGASGSEWLASNRPKDRRWLRILAILGLLVFVVLGGLAAAGAYTSSLHKTTYDNGKGDVYSLKYYAFSATRPPGKNLDPTGTGKVENALVSPVVAQPDLRLILTVHRFDGDPQLTAAHRPRLCNENMFQVTMDQDGSTAQVCAYNINSVPILYIFSFAANQKNYVGTIGYDYSQPSDPQKAQQVMQNIDLRKNQPHIQKIIASIRPQ